MKGSDPAATPNPLSVDLLNTLVEELKLPAADRAIAFSRETRRSAFVYNQSDMRVLRRAILSLIVSACVVVASLVAPEHLHEADAHHPTGVLHRHFETHGHDGSEVSDDDGAVIWLDQVGITEVAPGFAAPAVLPLERVEIVPQVTRCFVAQVYDATLPHGPPSLPRLLRGPPLSV